MPTVATELAYLSGAALTGGYILLSAAEYFSKAFTHSHLTPYAPYLKISLAIILIPFYITFRKHHHYYRGARINGCQPTRVFPHKDPILGIDLLKIMLKAVKEHRILDTWDEHFAKYGKTHWENATGNWYLLTTEAENAKAILSSQFENFSILSTRQKTTDLILGPKSIFSANGAEWQHSRAIIRPSFVRNQLADLECTDRHVDNFLAKIPMDGSSFDIDKLLYWFTMDVSTDFMFGHCTNLLTTPDQQSLDFLEAFDSASFNATTRGRLGWITLFIPDSKFNAEIKTCHRFVEHHVSKALAKSGEKERPYVFLDEIIKSGASQKEISDQILSMILGGRDTSASTLSTLFYTLARRPDVVKKIRAEVSRLDGRRPSWEDLKDLKYLNMTVKETLRVWGPVSTNMRTANKDTVLPRGGGQDGKGPMFVPKGTDIRYSLHGIHHNKEFYGEDADEFRPERWEENLRPSWDYIPFSGGPRICIGQQFALTQMMYLLARVFQQFGNVEARSDKPMRHKVTTTMNMVDGCWIALEPLEGFEKN
ncbi:Cytochrome P450 monooxygenase pspC [Cladobotryum mycophilum]|uniref:Cytochrome P450 monooxygenase pspC n=1 Tax=Cladobotryum mycophilum TaxID=491253 RepID=A0ABR0SHE2_9HYPO